MQRVFVLENHDLLQQRNLNLKVYFREKLMHTCLLVYNQTYKNNLLIVNVDRCCKMAMLLVSKSAWACLKGFIVASSHLVIRILLTSIIFDNRNLSRKYLKTLNTEQDL